MSHFSVVVIGPDVEGQLQPYHEFECTGHADEYVVTVDKLADARAEYERHTVTMLLRPDGQREPLYDEQGNYRKDLLRAATPEEIKAAGLGGRVAGLLTTGYGGNMRILQIPEGWQDIDVPAPEVERFEDFVHGYYGMKVVRAGEEPDLEDKHKYGYVRLDEAGNAIECVGRTNPNSRWDWWQIGGRWSGFFKLKTGATGELGDRSLLDDSPDERKGYADQVRKGDIDFEAMRNDAEAKAAERWDRIHAVSDQHPPLIAWEAMLAKHSQNVEAARKEYHSQAVVVALNEAFPDDVDLRWAVFDGRLEDIVQGTREVCLQRARAAVAIPFALVRDGLWAEKGRMHMFGVTSNEQKQDEWNKQITEIYDALSDDTLLTIVDCHT